MLHMGKAWEVKIGGGARSMGFVCHATSGFIVRSPRPGGYALGPQSCLPNCGPVITGTRHHRNASTRAQVVSLSDCSIASSLKDLTATVSAKSSCKCVARSSWYNTFPDLQMYCNEALSTTFVSHTKW